MQTITTCTIPTCEWNKIIVLGDWRTFLNIIHKEWTEKTGKKTKSSINDILDYNMPT